MAQLPGYLEAFQEQFASRFEYLPHSDPKQSGIRLEDHQQEAMKELYEGLLLNRERMCAVASCGSGKTLVEIAAVSASQAAKDQLGINSDRKDLVITEGRTVVSGIRKQFESLGIETGIWSGNRREFEPPIIVAGIHALQMAHSRRELHKYLPSQAIDLCVVDEVDRFLTSLRSKIIDALNPRITAGFTATKEWPDGRHISDRYGPVVHELPLLEAMKQRINVVPELFIYESQIRESDLKIRKGDYDPKILQAAWRHAELHRAVPDVYGHLLPENIRKNCPTLVYVPSKDMVAATTASFQGRFPELTIVGLTGEDYSHEVETALDGFRDGEVQVIVLCEMGGRGMNLENAKLLIDAYPTKSLNKLEQRHGRILRKIRPGSSLWKRGWKKNDAVIVQIVPKSNKFRPALFTDIIGGWQELQRLRGEREGETNGGSPEGDLVAQIRAHIEAKNPPLQLTLIRRINLLEQIRRERPQFDEKGFFRIPRRYVRRDDIEPEQQ
ncbi:MAG TPA: hypothetical protein DEB30_05395 [Candidatus Peribacter riflensis]|uniref:Uncharacterized protein n=1 Tax=Candidatus Peribacter riflensis TaxID=1735162 RepID=A0A0S1SGE6_9BACT|nr:MAG: hypothetical protein PeribacterA2_0116 [Candidatus Peribacter riflensis]OGJ76694.1 MAG: hypothetical protein A2398_03625 [Candidatus Peribacteria bacterium RIFOXYB1_FULL_57_12]OGJ78777.1 MAG: hypothetical protein A2412_02345 [Candidatus Peribacteria bacterium RIFOXYC1_FULL_58_8]ALM10614.1 MAG: hypothetical protein PeribacterB2_0116 [Candidatus Peribacter riflensis]ALM11716.1 MAG: hypothetical protein PeribacterC2_0115 [Candidatus Peribacter riflensis]